ncbi:hypothetical protein FF124_02550 [Martelella lutilitoris]|uniref:HTH luxR-type domain-containing protein n=1 Tax=Martelella lutilitoris TaxID=2583532 RepID=A0A5C4JXA9_9HYPH|nr:LuxR family transcriptional regulator [Martelella lutilitoris]TNB49860.1 hypothetical protein FF124_02550 [Martelella lutilitoris]
MKKYHDLLEYLVLIHEIDSLTSLRAAIDRVARRYDLARTGLFRRSLTPSRDAVAWRCLVESDPDAERAILFDGAVDGALLATGACGGAYFWDSAIEATGLNPALFRALRLRCAQAAQQGLTHGVTFPVFGREGLAGAFAMGRGGRIELSPLEISLFSALARETLNRCLVILQCGEGNMPARGAVPALSLRELTILKNLADGMTSVETGKTIGLTNHTVNWYVSGLQRKLGARNRQNLVALAFRLGLVS